MHDSTLIIVITVVIALLILQTAGLFLMSVLRREYNNRKYREMDRLRAAYHAKLMHAFAAGRAPDERDLAAAPGSRRWQAMEAVLLDCVANNGYEEQARFLLSSRGYIAFYEELLQDDSAQVRAESIHKLGRMKSIQSVPKLIPLLDDPNGEIASVTMRALSNIGSDEGLRAIVDRLAALLSSGRVTPKAIGTALFAFGPRGIPLLTERWPEFRTPPAAASVLEVLSGLPPDARTVPLALGALTADNPEVRSRSLKVLGRKEHLSGWPDLPDRIVPLLRDPVWYVRLQALRSLQPFASERTIEVQGKLLRDDIWQVRNEAARSLLLFGERSFDILLHVLGGSDRYAKDSICEEIGNTDFHPQLLRYRESGDDALRDKAGRILDAIRALGFTVSPDMQEAGR